MQANVQALSPIEPVVGAEDEASAYRKAIRAFSDVAVALTDAQDQSAHLPVLRRDQSVMPHSTSKNHSAPANPYVADSKTQ